MNGHEAPGNAAGDRHEDPRDDDEKPMSFLHL